MTPIHFWHRALQHLLRPIVAWCVRLGIGYGEFSRLAKPIFFLAALEDLKRHGDKPTDAAISLASGVHKGDVVHFAQSAKASDGWLQEVAAQIERIHPGNQVVAHWLALGLPRTLVIRGDDGQSFHQLVQSCQRDGASQISTKLVLDDLVRRQVVEVRGSRVHLLNEVGSPVWHHEHTISHFVGALHDHMQACLANMAHAPRPRFLEESLNVEGLLPESVAQISAASHQWWIKAMHSVTAQAIELSERDEVRGGDQRLRIGVYVYSQTMTQPSTSKEDRPA